MEISQDSWHHRLNRFFNGYPDGMSLCYYFWRTVLCVISSIAGIGVFIFLLYFAVTPFLYAFFGVDIATNTNARVAGFVITEIVIAIIGVITFADYMEDRKHRKATEPKEPNILVEYVKATKNKFCPIIEVV
jgi:hypothetical protein